MPRKIILKILIKVNLTVFFAWRTPISYFFLEGILVYIIPWNTKVYVNLFLTFSVQKISVMCIFFPNWPNHINGKPLFHTLDNEWRCETNSSTEYTQTKNDWVRFFFICRSTLQGLGFHSALTSQWHFCEIDIYVDTKNGDNIQNMNLNDNYLLWSFICLSCHIKLGDYKI